jgi:hypothetical protein
MAGWQRWWPVSGIVFVVLFVTVFLLVGDTGNTAADSATLLPAHEHRLFAAFLVGVLAMVAMLAFFASLRRVVEAAAPTRPLLATMSFVPATVTAALLPGSLAILGGGAQAGSDTSLSPALAAVILDVQYPFLAAGYMFLSVAVICVSVALLGSTAAPSWLAWSGVVAGVIGLASITFFPILLVALWVLVASIALTVRPPLLAAT